MFAKVKPNTQIIGQNLVYFTRVDSTNKLASELFKNNLAENGTVVVADYQTAGKGQLEREWESNPFENLMFSIGLKNVTNLIANPFLLNKCIAIALCNYMQQVLPQANVKIKWPNDIFVNNRKICGILVENTFSGHQLAYAIIGIGINVNQSFEHFQHINATSLFEQKGFALSRVNVFESVLEEIDSQLLMLEDKKEYDNINSTFDRLLLNYNSISNFNIDNQEISGIIKGCDNEGRLIIAHQNELTKYQHGTIKQII